MSMVTLKNASGKSVEIEGYKDFSSRTEKSFAIREPYKGYYIIEGKYLPFVDKDAEKDDEIRIMLSAQTEGAMDSNFLEGGFVRAYIKLYQDIEVY